MSTPPVRCPSCGNDNVAGSRFCSSCGSTFPDSTQPISTADAPTTAVPAVVPAVVPAAPTERIPAVPPDDEDKGRSNVALITALVIAALLVGWIAAINLTGDDGPTDLAGDLTDATPGTTEAPTAVPGGVTTAAPAGTATPTAPTPTATTGPTATPDPLAGVVLYDDCISYDASNLSVTGGGNLWQLVDGNSALTAHDTEDDADKMHAIAIRHKKQCFIGRANNRPDRKKYIVQYFDGHSGLASPSFNEDCIGYDNDDLFIEDLGAQGWRLRAGNVAMQLLDNESDAKKAWKLADDHDEQCFVGRGTSRIHQYWNG